jgi:histidinol-phosphate phosphatase family protein
MNKQKAVFLDRDGVINKNREDYVKSVDEFEIFQEVGESIKKLKENGFLVVIITNQSAINRGLTTIENIKEIHGILNDYLKEFETKVDGIFICPHRPDENCSCRKPKTELFVQAIKEFKIDPEKSWMIGDRETDIQAGQKIGCQCKKLDSKNSLRDIVNFIICKKNLL